MRYIYTFAVVSPRLENLLAGANALSVEAALLEARGRDDVAFFRCLLDAWDPSHTMMFQWFSQYRPSAARSWRRGIREGCLWLRRGGQKFLPQPSAREIARWYHNRSLGLYGLSATVTAFYDALSLHLGTKCPLVMTVRRLGPSFSDEEFRLMKDGV